MLTQGRDERISTALRRSMSDLRAAERSRGTYVVDLDVYCQPDMGALEDDRVKCTVCLAGSVMANRLGAKPTQVLSTRSWEDVHTGAMLRAMDSLRCGAVEGAASELRLLGYKNLGEPGAY